MDREGTMMPEFWEYLITHSDRSVIRFVAEKDRAWAEKQLDGDPSLLSYQAKPQICVTAMHWPTGRILDQLGRVRTNLQRKEMNHVHDSVVTINNTHWPAYRKKDGTLVDLRLFDPKYRSPMPGLTFRPDALRESGIPEALIEAAARSSPPGLVLFEDLPQSENCCKKSIPQPSTR
jgi:hypothetical protein